MDLSKNMKRTELMGEPIPQIWDENLQDYVPDEGQRKILKTREPSVSLIKEFLGVTHLTNINYHHYGATDGTDVYTELDVSQYDELAILVENNYDVDVNVFLHLALTQGSGKRSKVVLGTVLAGQTNVFYSHENLALKDLPVDYAGLLTTSQAAATTGTANLGVYGR